MGADGRQGKLLEFDDYVQYIIQGKHLSLCKKKKGKILSALLAPKTFPIFCGLVSVLPSANLRRGRSLGSIAFFNIDNIALILRKRKKETRAPG